MLRNFNTYFPKRLLFLLVGETLIILAAFQLAMSLRSAVPELSLFQDATSVLKIAFMALLCQLCLYFHDLYDLRIVSDRRELCLRLVQSLGVCSILVAMVYLLFPALFLGEGVFVLALCILIVVLIAWRIGFLWISEKSTMKEPVLILGTGELAKKVTTEILARPEVGFEVVGFVSDDPAMVGRSLVNPTVIGTVDELDHIVEHTRTDRIAVAVPQGRGRLPVAQLLDLKLKGILIEEATDLYERITGKIAVENLRPSWLIFSQGFRKSRLTLFYKRFFGIVFSLLGLILMSPAMIVIAILIKLDSKGPVFFKQERVGENGKTFWLLKFRSMCADAESRTGPVWASAQDDRVTRVGRFLRKTRLDEVPQFINVLKGDLNFVGPRPERLHFVEQLSKQIPYYNLRHAVKPGITGWAQIKYRYGASVDDTIEKLQYDLFYIKNMSVALDFLIVFQTVKTVLLTRGAH